MWVLYRVNVLLIVPKVNDTSFTANLLNDAASTVLKKFDLVSSQKNKEFGQGEREISKKWVLGVQEQQAQIGGQDPGGGEGNLPKELDKETVSEGLTPEAKGLVKVAFYFFAEVLGTEKTRGRALRRWHRWDRLVQTGEFGSVIL
ncbi:hypothetical protein AAF712_001547 [Marasmius tenuissimus]|uniref:Uncharacterized protein n=1 Tax=Marasmius tenuissimus TaxID=585030 RepID=A0ABR3ADS3_9AGAR